MKRYREKGGCLLLPPQSAVDARGHAVSNFAARIEHDEAFAIANGYFPCAPGVALTLPADNENLHYVTVGGVWRIEHEK